MSIEKLGLKYRDKDPKVNIVLEDIKGKINKILDYLNGIDLTHPVEGPTTSVDNTVVRWNGTTGRIVQGSGISIDDNNNVTGVGEITLTPKASSSGAEGTIFYCSDDNQVYIGVE